MNSTAVITVETLLIARYAEVLADGTLTMVGSGISTLLRRPGQRARVFLGGTLLADGPTGEHSQRLWLRLRDPNGEVATEALMDITMTLGSRVRIPLAFPLFVPSGGPEGSWQVEMSGADDMRVLHLDILDAAETDVL